MAISDMPRPDGGTASIREVYDLVAATKADLSQEIQTMGEGLTSRLDPLISAYEHRLTIIEQTQATEIVHRTALAERQMTWEKESHEAHQDLGKRLTTLENNHRAVKLVVGLVLGLCTMAIAVGTLLAAFG